MRYTIISRCRETKMVRVVDSNGKKSDQTIEEINNNLKNNIKYDINGQEVSPYGKNNIKSDPNITMDDNFNKVKEDCSILIKNN